MPRSNAVPLCFLAATLTLAQTSPPQILDQNWDLGTHTSFWSKDQGSRIMPLNWFAKLERANSTRPFIDHLDRFGFIDNPYRPSELPIGFAIGNHENINLNIKPDGSWVGLTCAACHTNKIRYKAASQPLVEYLIDGSPGLIDFDGFLAELVQAVVATATEPVKWRRFAAATSAQKNDFEALRDRLVLRRSINTPNVKAGRGRMDAFGHIFNQVAVAILHDDVSDAAPPDAPVSIPVLWHIAQHRNVQWNNTAPNLGVGEKADGAALRNVGEVLGVFGEVNVSNSQSKFRSSAIVPALREIEQMISTLRAPAWPKEFPAIQPGNAAGGMLVYQQHCSKCHSVVDARKPGKYVKAIPIPLEVVGTDPSMVDQYQSRRSGSGLLGRRARLTILRRVLIPSRTAERDYIRNLTGKLTVGALLDQYPSTFQFLLKNIIPLLVHQLAPLEVYKARPLDGVWATAPYLHNGSIPNLKELLKPPEQRVNRFCVGDGLYDPSGVGYEPYLDEIERNGRCPAGTFLVDTRIRGNLNVGHLFGTDLPPAQKDALIEYLKTL